ALLRFRDLDATTILARVEDRLQEIAEDVPGLARPVEPRVELGAGEAEGAGESDAGEEQGLGLADVGGGGGEVLLGHAHVGTAVEELGRQTGWHRPRP